LIPAPNSSKTVWREWAKKMRSSLPDVSDRVCGHLEHFLASTSARVVLSYKAFGSEISLERLTTNLPEIEFWTTRTNPHARLSLHPFSSATAPNKLGMLEPEAHQTELEPDLVDVVLVPGLVFDVFGTRLGYGAGFYDRLLPKLRSNLMLIGVTRDATLLETPLPKDGFDVAMTHVATESGIKHLSLSL
jgi:5-formyltetrahydrofolate cyclo-ligase